VVCGGNAATGGLKGVGALRLAGVDVELEDLYRFVRLISQHVCYTSCSHELQLTFERLRILHAGTVGPQTARQRWFFNLHSEVVNGTLIGTCDDCDWLEFELWSAAWNNICKLSFRNMA
jgi:hypothetical protein